jgi:hypothetical protein
MKSARYPLILLRYCCCHVRIGMRALLVREQSQWVLARKSEADQSGRNRHQLRFDPVALRDKPRNTNNQARASTNNQSSERATERPSRRRHLDFAGVTLNDR